MREEKIMPKLIEQFQPQQVILFGSAATSSTLKDSDLDLIIISEKFKGLPWLERIFEVLWTLKVLSLWTCYAYPRRGAS